MWNRIRIKEGLLNPDPQGGWGSGSSSPKNVEHLPKRYRKLAKKIFVFFQKLIVWYITLAKDKKIIISHLNLTLQFIFLWPIFYYRVPGFGYSSGLWYVYSRGGRGSLIRNTTSVSDPHKFIGGSGITEMSMDPDPGKIQVKSSLGKIQVINY